MILPSSTRISIELYCLVQYGLWCNMEQWLNRNIYVILSSPSNFNWNLSRSQGSIGLGVSLRGHGGLEWWASHKGHIQLDANSPSSVTETSTVSSSVTMALFFLTFLTFFTFSFFSGSSRRSRSAEGQKVKDKQRWSATMRVRNKL